MATSATKTRRKATASKRSTAKKTTAKKSSTAKAGPKTAKRSTAKKTAAKRTVAKKEKGAVYTAKSPKVLERYSQDQERVMAAVKKHGDDWEKVAATCKMSVGKAQRMYYLATLKPGDKIVVDGRPEKDVAADIVRLRDEEGLNILQIWARTNLSGDVIRALYRKGGGTGGRASSTKATPRAKRSAKRSTKKASAGRKSRSGLLSELVRKAHDLSTPDDELVEVLDGRKITVEADHDGIALAPAVHTVDVVKAIGDSPKYGRYVHFIDENKQHRHVPLAHIVRIR